MKVNSALLYLTLFAGSACGLEPAEIYDRARAASAEVLVGGRLAGSGWFASKEGFAFTAAHVVRGAGDAEISLRTHGRGEVPARLVAVDPSHDLALLSTPDVKGALANWPFLPVSEELPKPGDTTYLFGSAYFRHELMIRGSVARKEATYEFLSGPRNYIRCLHISAPSPLGTSGGCWVNTDGEVVGLQSAFLSKDGAGMGIAFTSAPDAIRELLDSKETRVTATLGCGLEESVSQSAAFLARFPKGTRGLVPVLHVAGGPAEEAGLVGDIIITHVEGVPAPLRDAVLDAIRSRKPGDKLTVTVLRPAGVKASEVEVTLGGM